MRHPVLITCCLLVAACGPKTTYRDFTTPERAARSFVEAGRVGDMGAVRDSLVAAERDQDVHCDYGTLQRYRLVRDRELDDDHVVVMLQAGTVSSPLACVREHGEWKITIRGSLSLLQRQLRDQQAAAPR